jgi:hypothetical protein
MLLDPQDFDAWKIFLEASNGFVNPTVSSDAWLKEMAYTQTP